MRFSPIYIEATDLNDAWFQLLWALDEKGRSYKIDEGSYKGDIRIAFDEVAGTVHYPHQRPLAPIVPEGVPQPATEETIEEYFVSYVMNGECAPNEDYRYGTFIAGGYYEIPTLKLIDCDDITIACKNFRVRVPSQIDWIIRHFKEKGFGNEHCYITIGYPESNLAYDIPYSNEQERKTSPCLRGLDFRILEEDGKFFLTTKVIYRSWDLYSGFPTNMGGFTLLNEFVAEQLGIEAGPLTFTCKSLHIYGFQLDAVKARLKR